jgi:hypothetical protein
VGRGTDLAHSLEKENPIRQLVIHICDDFPKEKESAEHVDLGMLSVIGGKNNETVGQRNTYHRTPPLFHVRQNLERALREFRVRRLKAPLLMVDLLRFSTT